MEGHSALFIVKKMPTKHHQLNKFFRITVLFVVLLIFLTVTNPQHIALPLLIVPFILIGLIVYGITKHLLTLLKLTSQSVTSRLIPVLVASSVVTWLLLASLNQLSWKDVIFGLTFSTLLVIYLVRADFLRR